MENEIIKRIETKTGVINLVELLSKHLPGTDLNSLLLEVFDKKTGNITPAELLKQYQANRYVHPAETDMIGLLTAELETLKFLREHNFQPIELSPVSQLGSCSIIASVDQKKVISAVRNTEVTADATNAMALHIADLRKSGVDRELLRFSTVHRHVRCQPFKEKGFSAHFKVGCMVSSGRDTGNYEFEASNLLDHILTLTGLFKDVYRLDNISFKLLKMDGYEFPERLLDVVFKHVTENENTPEITIGEAQPNNYYKGIQCKMIVEINEREIEIADGGFVDWTQQLLGNKKERMLIFGFGLGFLYQLRNR